MTLLKMMLAITMMIRMTMTMTMLILMMINDSTSLFSQNAGSAKGIVRRCLSLELRSE